MKVLYISGMYPTPTYPQKGIFCHEQVKALKRIGVEVDVIVPMTIYDKEYTTKNWIYEGVSIRYIKYFKFPGTRCFEKIGIYLYYALMYSKIDFSQYDVIHADAPLPAGDAVRRISKKYGIPYVIHGHGLDVFLEESYSDAKNCEKIINTCVNVYTKCSAIIGVSEKVLDKIQEKVDISNKKYVVYNGVDIEKFFPVQKYNKKIEVLTVGNLIWLKGHEYTIRAIKLLNEKYPDKFSLTIIGKGPLENKLKELVADSDIASIVKFTGYIPYDCVKEYMQNSDIFVLPSFYEALGCVYLEAMSCGIPTIGCLNNGIDEVITNNVDGFLIHNKNVDELVEYLEVLIEPKERIRIGKNARKKIEKNYTWINSAQELVYVYKQILQR